MAELQTSSVINCITVSISPYRIVQVIYTIQTLNCSLALAEDTDLGFPGLNLDCSKYCTKTFPKET